MAVGEASEAYDYLFKIIVVGDGAVGKTALSFRFDTGKFEQSYKMTIGAANSLIAAINKGQGKLPEPTMLKLIYFKNIKAISELEKGYMKADYEFYKDKTNYIYDTKINPFKKLMANRIAGREIAKMMKNR